jgi:hypothetical protein
MRRLLTGRAMGFNRKHRRSGQLFQNRYKSILCQEEPYLLEMIRYIHLNPLRAGLVTDIDKLDRYPFSGHGVVMGRKKEKRLVGQHMYSIILQTRKQTHAAATKSIFQQASN